MLGDGAGAFTSGASIGASTLTEAVRLADLDGDGDVDLAMLDVYADNVRVFRNDGAAHFALASTLATGGLSHGLALGDINGDGIVDAAVVSSSSDGLYVWAGNGDATFQTRQGYTAPRQPWVVTIADLAW